MYTTLNLYNSFDGHATQAIQVTMQIWEIFITRKITSFQLLLCPSSSIVDSPTILVLVLMYSPSLSSHDATKHLIYIKTAQN